MKFSNTFGAVVIFLTFLIYLIVRTNQYYKSYGFKFCVVHSLIDTVVLCNYFAPITLLIYFLYKKTVFKKMHKEIGKGYIWIDLLLLFIIIGILWEDAMWIYNSHVLENKN